MKVAALSAVLPLLSLTAAAPHAGARRDGYKPAKTDDYSREGGEWKDDGKHYDGDKKDDAYRGDYGKDYKGDKKDDSYRGDDKKDDGHRDDAHRGDDYKKDDKYDDRKDKYFKSYPFEFTSTAVAYATPDTIINNDQESVPGLEDGYGTFAFGLNSVQDVICYVSLSLHTYRPLARG